MSDLIYRQDAIDALDKRLENIPMEQTTEILLLRKDLRELPSAEPEQHGRIFQEIVVEYPSISTYPEHEGKPYFSIKYVEDGQCHIGYGTYKPEVLSEYMKKYFISSAQSEIIRCKDCKHYYYADNRIPQEQRYSCALDGDRWKPEDFCSYAERRTDG